MHTNIPVNSDNYEMLQAAHAAVKRIMALARSLDGVISGEHGIGITKLEFLSDEELRPFTEYKAKVDPEGRFNKGKLLRNKEHTIESGRGIEAKEMPVVDASPFKQGPRDWLRQTAGAAAPSG